MKNERTDTRFATWLVLVAGLWGVLDTTARSQTAARLDPVVNVFLRSTGSRVNRPTAATRGGLTWLL